MKFTTAIERFLDFSEEKILYQLALHEIHDRAAELSRQLKRKSVAAIAAEQQEFAVQEKKLHLQAGHFEKSLHLYQQSLADVRSLVKKTTRVMFRGRTYEFLRTSEEIEIKTIATDPA